MQFGTAGSYYRERQIEDTVEDYWAPKADPDGVVRDRTSDVERLQYLSDMQDEIAWINAMEPKTVLDFGAGMGWLLGAIDAKYKVAVEPSVVGRDSCGNVANEVYETLQHAGNTTGWPFDVIVAWHVFEHLYYPAVAMETLRDMTESGYLLLGTPDFNSPCAQRFGNNYRMLHDKTHCSLFSQDSMAQFLRHHDWEIMDIKYPFPERYATVENFARWNDTSKTSPPWPGNWLTFYCRAI